uniref:Ascorbate peroxidase n=1 Tax=Lepeophtheirus salmonis TaxID=72036 RepID=D3PIJ8_LEPSM|nr:ascorbate peroxidase [Lepeophtheirus salmonis]
MIAIYSLLLLFCGQSLANTRMKQSTVDGILKNLTALVNSTEKDGVKFLVPGIVRLVFHDCVDGCDACLNFDLISNRGLKKIVDALEPTYENYKSILSRADLWALASKAAIQIAIENNNNRCSDQSCKTPQINIRFRYGRKDCPTSPSHEENTFIPSPLQNSSVLMPWFKDTFNFKPNQVVAIMGMHTLGKAGAPFNSAWEQGNTDGLSNNYYKQISDPNHCWVQEYIDPKLSGIPNKIFFWRTELFKAFALPVDMTLYKAIQVNETTGESSCSYHDCKRASTMGMFKRYAASVESWTKHIRHLFPRMLEKTTSKLLFPRRNM